MSMFASVSRCRLCEGLAGIKPFLRRRNLEFFVLIEIGKCPSFCFNCRVLGNGIEECKHNKDVWKSADSWSRYIWIREGAQRETTMCNVRSNGPANNVNTTTNVPKPTTSSSNEETNIPAIDSTKHFMGSRRGENQWLSVQHNGS